MKEGSHHVSVDGSLVGTIQVNARPKIQQNSLLVYSPSEVLL